MKIAINHERRTITAENDEPRAVFIFVTEFWQGSNACPGDPPICWLWPFDETPGTLIVHPDWTLQLFERGRFVL